MPDRVVDASVLGARTFNEPTASEADRLIGESRIIAPLILVYELTNIARKKILLEPAQEESALEAALNLDILWFPVDHLEVLRLALETGLTTYDASYLYVSQSTGVPLVTFDRNAASLSA